MYFRPSLFEVRPLCDGDSREHHKRAKRNAKNEHNGFEVKCEGGKPFSFRFPEVAAAAAVEAQSLRRTFIPVGVSAVES